MHRKGIYMPKQFNLFWMLVCFVIFLPINFYASTYHDYPFYLGCLYAYVQLCIIDLILRVNWTINKFRRSFKVFKTLSVIANTPIFKSAGEDKIIITFLQPSTKIKQEIQELKIDQSKIAKLMKVRVKHA